MYVAYYGRPGDSGGLSFWAAQFDQSNNLDAVLSAFGDSAEYQTSFGSLSNEQLVNGLFTQMFNRDADPEGLIFYEGRLETGAATLASIAKQIADGAINDDGDIINNKIAAANSFSQQVSDFGIDYTEDDIDSARGILQQIDAGSTSLDEGLTSVDNWISSERIISGEMIYRLRQQSGNQFACVHCHALNEPADNGFRRAGHAIGDALRRPSYKNGLLVSMLDAVNSCLNEWMVADSWTETSVEWLALQQFLEEQAGDEQVDPISFSIIEPPPDLTGGVAADGKNLFNESCAICHANDGEGSNVAPKVNGLNLEPDYIARRVRTSGHANSTVYNNLTGGVMPFWSADRLDDSELRHLIAYLVSGDSSDVTDDTGTDDPGSSECAADHEKVGQTAILTEYFHDVGGVARIEDNCTIVVSGFTYDGNGIVVEFYAGQNRDFDPPAGFSISEDIKGTRFTGGTYTITLNDGVTLDDFDSISVWCVDAGVNFGDGVFQ